MKKNELRTGMIVEFRNQRRGMVFKYMDEGSYIVTETGWTSLDDYDDDLLHLTNVRSLDIMKVYNRHGMGYGISKFTDLALSYATNAIYTRSSNVTLTIKGTKIDFTLDEIEKLVEDIREIIPKARR